ncbi:hypothetical protein ACM26V_04740 [Salipaludibacillus sp. HK11]|uniref:hypothetical protein n=1 Tax=Salipaludibacillus sp. HK11 TaxID=3394320 RepID=UPI0039FD0B3C
MRKTTATDIIRQTSFKQTGFLIVNISQVKEGYNVSDMIQKKEAEIKMEWKVASDKLSRIKTYRKAHKRVILMNYQAVMKELPVCIVYSKTLRVPNYDAYFKLVPEIGEEVTAANPSLKLSKPEYIPSSFTLMVSIKRKICEVVEQFGVEP